MTTIEHSSMSVHCQTFFHFQVRKYKKIISQVTCRVKAKQCKMVNGLGVSDNVKWHVSKTRKLIIVLKYPGQSLCRTLIQILLCCLQRQVDSCLSTQKNVSGGSYISGVYHYWTCMLGFFLRVVYIISLWVRVLPKG